ncbi:hypothetical protein EDD16DRAFT_1517451 [Pisolithus croceorrhizus]|nr:hypothetical protein EDD16DRAFT_1517451 [Pisolithus croceorrhizus]
MYRLDDKSLARGFVDINLNYWYLGGDVEAAASQSPCELTRLASRNQGPWNRLPNTRRQRRHRNENSTFDFTKRRGIPGGDQRYRGQQGEAKPFEGLCRERVQFPEDTETHIRIRRSAAARLEGEARSPGGFSCNTKTAISSSSMTSNMKCREGKGCTKELIVVTLKVPSASEGLRDFLKLALDCGGLRHDGGSKTGCTVLEPAGQETFA